MLKYFYGLFSEASPSFAALLWESAAPGGRVEGIPPDIVAADCQSALFPRHDLIIRVFIGFSYLAYSVKFTALRV